LESGTEAGGLAGRHVVIDVGTGDGRWLFRLARARPEWFCIGIDANLDAARHVARRARRSPARGGAPNLSFVRERAEALPGSLRGMAAEVYVQYPWGGLLRAVTGGDPATLARIAALLRAGGRLRVLVNVSVLHGEAAALVPSYAAAGLRIVRRETAAMRHRSSWAGRLGQGRALLTLCVEADLIWPPSGVGWDGGGQGI